MLLTVPLSLYVLQLTGSARQFAQTWIISAIPHVLIGPVVGVWVDRLPQKPLLMSCDFLRAGYLVLASYLAWTHQCSLLFLQCSLFGFAVVAVFFRSGCAPLLPRMLDEEELIAGNALRRFVIRANEVAAPVLATLCYQWWGMPTIFALTAVTFGCAGVMKLGLLLPPRAVPSSPRSFWKELPIGFQTVICDRRLRSLVLNGTLTQCFITPFFMLGTLHILIQVMQVPEVYVGTLRSCAVIGSLLPIVLISWMQARFPLTWNVTLGLGGVLGATALLFLLIVPDIGIWLSRHPAGAAAFFSGARLTFEMMVGIYGVFVATFYQLHVPEHDLGKYTAVTRMAYRLGQIGGLSLYGYLFDARPLTDAFVCLFFGICVKILIHLPFVLASRKRSESWGDRAAECAVETA
ncbi:MAG: MFS transporter [Deltaproteobacteria bacterium]|nr:MFS transporter [Deltaproteobacteria bacterium]